MAACQEGHESCAGLLISKGADIHAKDNDGTLLPSLGCRCGVLLALVCCGRALCVVCLCVCVTLCFVFVSCGERRGVVWQGYSFRETEKQLTRGLLGSCVLFRDPSRSP